MNEYKLLNSFDDRLKESTRIKLKHTDKIPVIIDKYRTKDLIQIDKHKYLLPYDLTIAQFLFIIRKKIKLSPEQSIFIFCNNILLTSNKTISEVYDLYKDDDNFLYLYYDIENTFG